MYADGTLPVRGSIKKTRTGEITLCTAGIEVWKLTGKIPPVNDGDEIEVTDGQVSKNPVFPPGGEIYVREWKVTRKWWQFWK